MAKIGEGDPRWIVTDRADGANVNNWHWSEKNVTSLFKDIVHQKMQNQKVFDDGLSYLKTTTFNSLEIEAVIYNRKNKLSLFIEGSAVLDFEGSHDGCEPLTGSFTLPEVDATFNKTAQVDVSSKNNPKNATQEKVLEKCRNEGRNFVKEAMMGCIEDLRVVAGIGAQSPTDPQSIAQAQANLDTREKEAEEKEAREKAAQSASSDPSTERLSYKIEWGCPASEIFSVLTDQGRTCAFTRSPAVIQPTPGGTFSVMAGAISGKFLEIETNKRIKFSFRGNDWPTGRESTVTLSFDQRAEDKTIMSFDHVDIPLADLERTQQGWHNLFWNPIKKLFGFGMIVQ